MPLVLEELQECVESFIRSSQFFCEEAAGNRAKGLPMPILVYGFYWKHQSTVWLFREQSKVNTFQNKKSTPYCTRKGGLLMKLDDLLDAIGNKEKKKTHRALWAVVGTLAACICCRKGF